MRLAEQWQGLIIGVWGPPAQAPVSQMGSLVGGREIPCAVACAGCALASLACF